MNRFVISYALLYLLTSCGMEGSDDLTISEYGGVTSTAGHTASVFEIKYKNGDVVTAVIVEFAGNLCGSGAASVYDIDMDIMLEWESPSKQVITHPPGVNVVRNPSGEHFKCGKYMVDVVIEDEKAPKKFNKNKPPRRAFCTESHKINAATVCLLIQRYVHKDAYA